MITRVSIRPNNTGKIPHLYQNKRKGIPLRYDAQNSHTAHDVHQGVCLCYLWEKNKQKEENPSMNGPLGSVTEVKFLISSHNF